MAPRVAGLVLHSRFRSLGEMKNVYEVYGLMSFE